MDERLRYDGLYRQMGSDGHCQWYRFYESGEVLSASTSPGPTWQVAGWLRLEGREEDTPMGQYSHDGDRLCFTLSWRLPRPPGAPLKHSEHEVFLEAGRLRDTFPAARTGDAMEVVYDFVPLLEEDLDGEPKTRTLRPQHLMDSQRHGRTLKRAVSPARRLGRSNRASYPRGPVTAHGWATEDFLDARLVCDRFVQQERDERRKHVGEVLVLVGDARDVSQRSPENGSSRE